MDVEEITIEKLGIMCYGAIQVLCSAVGVGGGLQLSRKKALRRCTVQRYLALRGGGGGRISRKKALCYT